MKISKPVAKNLRITLNTVIDTGGENRKRAKYILTRLDNADTYGKIVTGKANTDEEIPEDELIIRTAKNGKKYAMSTKTGETSGLGPEIDKETGKEADKSSGTASPIKNWNKMSDGERLAARHPKNPKREGHKEIGLRHGMSRKEMANIVAKDTGASPEQARKMVEGLRHYAGATYSYHDVRVAGRCGSEEEYHNEKGKRMNSYADAKAWADSIEEYLESAPVYDGGPIFRGISDSHDPEKAERLFNEAKKAMEDGKTIDMKGMSSWSTDGDHAGEFMKDCKYHDIPDGMITGIMYKLPTTYQGASVDHFNEDIQEDEVLISGKARFRPVKAYIDKSIGRYGCYVVELEEI